MSEYKGTEADRCIHCRWKFQRQLFPQQLDAALPSSMAYSTDFNDVSLGRAIGGRRTESLQGNPDTVNQYLSSPDSTVHYVPFMDPLLLPQCSYRVVDAYASYPTPPMQHQYISSDSSIVSSNDMSRVMGASMLPEASEGRFCYEPTEYNAAIAHAMPDYASHPPEFINLDMSRGCIALERQNDNFNSVMLSNMSWDQGDTGIPASHSEIDHHRNPTNIPVNTSQPRTQDEQKHVCDKPECGGKLFTRQSDLKRHKDEQHNPEKINFICGCCKDKPKAPSFKRMEKLMDHKNKFHGYVKGARLLHCLEASCQAESTCVLCFCTEDGLEHHMSQAHQYKARCLPDRLHAIGLLDETKAISSLLETSSKGQDGDSNHLSPLSSAKRATDAEQGIGAKRFRDQYDGTPKMMDVAPASRSALDFYTSPRFELQGQSAGLYCIELLVRNVWPSDFFNLAQFIRSAEAEMKISHACKSEAPLISFNLPQRWIKLRGLEKVTSAFKARLEAFLENRRKAEPFQNIRNNQESVLCLRTRFGPTMQRPANGPKLFPVRSKEDLPLLDTWHGTIVPSLPGILQDVIGDNYSASMVRKGSSEQYCRAVIQIQMPKMPSAVVQNEIRSQILSLFDANLARYNTTVEFSAGSLKLLAEDGLEIDFDSSDAVSSTCEVASEGYPHYKRYWSRPGMGASVGLRCSENVSATLGCYIHVDDKLYLLTVEHLVRKSRNGLTEGIGDQRTLLSPAPSEVEEMKTTMDQFLRDIEYEIGAQWKETHGDAESVLADLDQPPEAIEGLLEHHRVARQHRSELDLDVECFELGRVVYLSDSNERNPSSAEAARISASTGQERPHMDWALCDVVTERAGINQHRYQMDDETGQVDFWSGDIENFGAGQPCEDTGTVEANEKVHFVGQTTGRRCGSINAAKMLVSYRTSKTHEWTLVPATDDQMNSKGKGDSGASIIRDRDNKLVGHLWARTQNGLWVFTAIESVFQDISRKLDAKDVRLAPIGKRGRSSPLAVADTEIANEVEEICRDKKDEAHVPKTYSIASMKLPKRQKQRASLGPESNAANAGLPSPPKTPAAAAAAAAAASNKSEAQGPMTSPLAPPQAPNFTIILHNTSWHDKLNVHAKRFSTAEADKENKLSLVYIVRNWPRKKTTRQSTFPYRRQPLQIRSANTWPARQSVLQHWRSSLKAQRPIVAN